MTNPPTLLSALLKLCGLSYNEAAAFLDVRHDNVMRWCSGKKDPPEGVLLQLSDLHQRQVDAADEILEAQDLDDGHPYNVPIVTSDDEARAYGWPTASAQAVVAALVQTQVDEAIVTFEPPHRG